MCEFRKTLKILFLDDTSLPEDTADDYFQELIGDISRATEGWSVNKIKMVDNNKIITNFNKKYLLGSEVTERIWKYWYE